jgi:membrane-bound hydrogenase subunit beta
VLQYLKEQFGFTHLATITGLDLGESFEVVYHMASNLATVNVRILTPRSDPKIPSTCSVIPGAILYERELQDMFGMVVENIPDPRPLLLADDWPAGEFPLRKDWQFDRPAEVIPGGK